MSSSDYYPTDFVSYDPLLTPVVATVAVESAAVAVTIGEPIAVAAPPSETATVAATMVEHDLFLSLPLEPSRHF